MVPIRGTQDGDTHSLVKGVEKGWENIRKENVWS